MLLTTLATAAGVTLAEGYQWLPAHRLTRVYHPTVEVELPLFITEITDDNDLQRLAQTLVNAYPPTHKVAVLPNSVTDNTGHQVTLRDLCGDQPPMIVDAPGPFALCVPPLVEGSSFSALQAIVAHLRAPDGCPWDREQTLLTMRHDLLGECAEVLEAIDREVDGTDNSEHIAEELGDLFMAGVLTLQIAIDEGRFQLADAMRSIVSKLIRRHPHVFGDVQVDGVDAIWANWDAIKRQEKAAKGQTVDHPLDGVPAALPALEKARELQSKAKKAGLLDRTALADEWEAVAAAFHARVRNGALTEEALGQLLWTLVAVAHEEALNAEDALRSYGVRYRATV
jgi:tetrapyrrole methylase family protein/MazG family protein